MGGDEVFSRVHTGNKEGYWLLRRKDIKGLTALQIKEKFALPELPTHISDVFVPKGTKMRMGIANSHPVWGRGGKPQYELLEELPKDFYKNTKELLK